MIDLKTEKERHYRAVEELTREAFWNQNVPGCSEHYLAHILRGRRSFISRLDYVALEKDQVIANIMYTKAKILNDDGTKVPVISFGPLCVSPAWRGLGIATTLINYTKERAIEMGYKAIVIFGSPEFYKRVGFVPAEQYKIGTAWNTYADALLALELVPGALSRCHGRFIEDEVFDVDPKEVAKFDKTFPKKEKISGLPSQLKFAEQLKKSKPRK